MTVIRKISIGKEYKENAMHYSVGQFVYDNHEIVDIIDHEEKYVILVKDKNGDIKEWKDFNKNMGISIEYSLEY